MVIINSMLQRSQGLNVNYLHMFTYRLYSIARYHIGNQVRLPYVSLWPHVHAFLSLFIDRDFCGVCDTSHALPLVSRTLLLVVVSVNTRERAPTAPHCMRGRNEVLWQQNSVWKPPRKQNVLGVDSSIRDGDTCCSWQCSDCNLQ